MRAAVFLGPGKISVEDVDDPRIVAPTDAIVQVESAGVCGSDLWTYRGKASVVPGARIGHEFVGSVVEVGHGVQSLRVGDWVIAPFRYSDGTCDYCHEGLESSCRNGGFWSREEQCGGQAEFVRVPYADATLVAALPDRSRPDPSLHADMLALCDVFPTGYHAAFSAGVHPGASVAVVGDGAVGQCAILAARLLGSEQAILVGSRHYERCSLASRMGATTVTASRGREAVDFVRSATAGRGVDVVLECVGTPESFRSSLALVHDGGTVGYVGLPHGTDLPLSDLFSRNIAIVGGVCPARHYIPELLGKVLDGTASPGEVFTKRFSLDDVAQAYAALDRREVVKPLVSVSADVAGPII